MFITLLITCIAVLIFWLKWNYSFWSRNKVPGPKPTWFVGNLGSTLTMKESISVILNKCYQEYNTPYVGMYQLFNPAILLRDADLVKDVLIKDHQSFHANDVAINEKYDRLFAHNPFVTKNEKWKRARTILTPLFTTNKVKIIFPLMEDTCLKLVQYLKEQGCDKDIEAKSLGVKFGVQNVGRCAFSIDAKCFEGEESDFFRMAEQMFHPGFWMGLRFMAIKFFPILSNFLPIGFVTEDVNEWFLNLIKSNKLSRSSVTLQNEDLLQMLLNVEKKYDLSEEELAGHAMALFAEGFETTSIVMSFLLYDLARNINIQENLYNEIIDMLSRNENRITFDALQEMKYFDSVICESMRMNVVISSYNKLCTKPYKLPILKGQKQEFTVQPGTTIYIPVRSLHMDPKYYPNPDEFDPTRFSGDARHSIHKGVYLPFGEGPRMCTGMRFGLAQVKASVLYIVKNFKITVSKNNKPFVADNRVFMYQARDGLLLNFELRQ